MRKIVLFLSFFVLFLSYSPSAFGKRETVEISKEIIQAATIELKGYSSYLNSEQGDFNLQLIRELYHTDDSLIGYYAHIYENNELIGFAVISAKQELGNLLEWGPFENGIDTHYADILQEKPQQKAYYLSLGDIIIANNVKQLNNILDESKEKNIQDAIKNDPKSVNYLKTVEPGIDIEKGKKELKEFKSKNVNKPLQEISSFKELSATETLNSGITLASTLPTNLSLSRVYQRTSGVVSPNSACGPAVGVMIANYYRNVRLFSNIRNSAYYGGTAKHINHMYYMMNSYFFGTNQYSFHNGLQTEANIGGGQYAAKSRAYGTSSEPSIANIQNAINKKYPLALLESLNYSNGLRYHWTVIAAYNSNGQVGYYDPDGSNASMKWVSWTSIMGKRSYTYLALD